MNDVIIIGGSYAGIAAALQLGRARRRVLVVDAGQRRNRFASSSHGFLGQDGQSPEAIAAKGRAEVLAYPTVTWRDATVSDVRAIPGGFAVRVAGEEHASRRLVLATGVVDELPPVPGLADRWGTTVFHCPYCHGYELDRGPLGVLATSPMSVLQASLVSEWSTPGGTTLFLDGAVELDAAQQDDLASRGIVVERARIASVGGDAPVIEVRLVDGRAVRLAGLFVHARSSPGGRFAEQLGCELEMGPVGSFYKTDPMKETTVPGVFACGDVAAPMGALSFAVADGVRAGVGAHHSLIFRRPPG